MLLVIDVGNTQTVLGTFDGAELQQSWRIKTDAQGKTHALALLRIEVEVPDDYQPPPVGATAPGGEL